jgi:hypothetical protein
MSRGQQTFKQSDVTKALKATVKAGIAVERVEIDKNGKIVVVTAKPEDAVNGEKLEENEWDRALQ